MKSRSRAPRPPFGGYQLLSLLGVGGYARVYRAQELDGEQRVLAIKIARDGDEGRSRKVIRALSNEAEIMSRLDHPNLVEVFEFGQVDGHYFIAMELVDGLPLKEVLKRCRRRGIQFGPIAAADVIRQIASGLHEAHTLTDDGGEVRPVIHRDLKPANVMVTPKGHVKVMDFGVAKWPLAEVSTTAGIIKGTPLYMAPEQVRALPVTPAADIFSLGTVLYQLITGRPLFKADSIKALLRKVARADIEEQMLLVPEDCQPIVPLLRRCLRRSPEERIGSAQQFIHELGECLTAIEDEDDLATLIRAVLGARSPRPAPLTPHDQPTMANPAYSQKATGMNWSVRLRQQRGVLVEYDRKKTDED